MNIYDPSDRICYVHLSGPAEARSLDARDRIGCSPLPAGYANESPKTRLQRIPGQPLGERTRDVMLTA